MEMQKKDVPAGQAPAPKGIPVTLPGAMPEQQQPKPAQSLFEPASLSGRGLLPEDLPYADEVESARARRPSNGSRWLSVGVFLFFAAFIGWASVATLDEVTHAEGQVIPSSRTQVIQNLEGGILRSVDVFEGDIVDKGDVLARLDNELAVSSLRDMLYKAMENLTAIHRLRASVAGTELTWPSEYRAWLEKGIGHKLTDLQFEQGLDLAAVQQETFAVMKRQRESELSMLRSQYAERDYEFKEQISRQDELSKTLSLIHEQIKTVNPLLARGTYPKMQYLELQERLVHTQGELATLQHTIPKAKAATEEAKHRIELRNAELDTNLNAEINKRSLELASLHESLSASSDRVTRTELRSPVHGAVKKIYINTVGGVVKPGESIMEIVPLGDTLLIEARVRPADVAFLHPGQKSVVKVSAYDYSIYGGLDGVLELISPDTIEDKRGDLFYQVRVRTPRTSIEYHNEQLPIMPGMMTTVDILTGKKTVLDYLLKPILKAKQNALREK